MKHSFIIIIAVAVLVLAGSQTARAQVTPTTEIVLTTSTNTVAASGTATVTSGSFSPNSITGFAVVPNFVLGGTANNTGNVTFNFQASPDGVNWTTTYPYSFTVAATGTTPVTAFYNFAPVISGSGATNIPWIRLGQVINASSGGTLTINSITISKSNR